AACKSGALEECKKYAQSLVKEKSVNDFTRIIKVTAGNGREACLIETLQEACKWFGGDDSKKLLQFVEVSIKYAAVHNQIVCLKAIWNFLKNSVKLHILDYTMDNNMQFTIH